MSTSTPVRRPRRGRSLPVVAALLLPLAACASVRTEGRPPDLAAISGFAWRTVGADVALPVAPAGAGEEIRAALVQELGALGLREVPPGKADVLVSYHLWVETKVRQNDPYFAVYAAEEVEVGTLSVDLSDPVSGELIWRGTASRELRVSAVLAGPFDQQLTPTDAPRRWRLRESVSKIARQLAGDG